MYDILYKKLFNKDVCVFSYGCICLYDLKVMVVVVLGKFKDYVILRIVVGWNEQEKVIGDLLVYVFYFIVWLEVDGSMGYYIDVYDWDWYLL